MLFKLREVLLIIKGQKKYIALMYSTLFFVLAFVYISWHMDLFNDEKEYVMLLAVSIPAFSTLAIVGPCYEMFFSNLAEIETGNRKKIIIINALNVAVFYLAVVFSLLCVERTHLIMKEYAWKILSICVYYQVLCLLILIVTRTEIGTISSIMFYSLFSLAMREFGYKIGVLSMIDSTLKEHVTKLGLCLGIFSLITFLVCSKRIAFFIYNIK